MIFFLANATNKTVSYTSDNPEVARVNYEGFVTGLSKGQATSTATTQDGNFTVVSKINVSNNIDLLGKVLGELY